MATSIALQIEALRKEYRSATLNENDVRHGPISHFEKWFQDAVDAKIAHPDAMTLATAAKGGTPDARIVLLKNVKDGHFFFYTNYLSAKGQQLEENPSAALLFFWPELERQVRIKGLVSKTTTADSDAYFATRPRGSQLAASISAQSEVIQSREWLENQAEQKRLELAGKAVTRPPHWGGYVLTPREIEFWQGRENRLHDRLRFRFHNNAWILERLAP